MAKIGVYYTTRGANAAVKRNKKRYSSVIKRKNKSKKGLLFMGIRGGIDG